MADIRMAQLSALVDAYKRGAIDIHEYVKMSRIIIGEDVQVTPEGVLYDKPTDDLDSLSKWLTDEPEAEEVILEEDEDDGYIPF